MTVVSHKYEDMKTTIEKITMINFDKGNWMKRNEQYCV